MSMSVFMAPNVKVVGRNRVSAQRPTRANC
jgi:hypothetical protein